MHWAAEAPAGAHYLIHEDAINFCDSPGGRVVTHAYMFDSLFDVSLVDTIGDRILDEKLPALLSIVTFSKKLAMRLKGDGRWTLRTSAQVQTSEGAEEPQAFCDAPKQVRPIARIHKRNVYVGYMDRIWNLYRAYM